MAVDDGSEDAGQIAVRFDVVQFTRLDKRRDHGPVYRDIDCHYKTAFVLAHKLREAIVLEIHTGKVLDGHFEISKAIVLQNFGDRFSNLSTTLQCAIYERRATATHRLASEVHLFSNWG